MPGVKFTKSWMPVMPTMSRFSEVKADTATGTSCSDCSRFSAVTTSSSRVAPSSTAWAMAGWATAAKASAETPAARNARRGAVLRDM